MCDNYYSSNYNSPYDLAYEASRLLPEAFKTYNSSRGNLQAMKVAEAWIMQLAVEWPVHYNSVLGVWVLTLRDGCERPKVIAHGPTKLETILKATRMMNLYCGV